MFHLASNKDFFQKIISLISVYFQEFDCTKLHYFKFDFSKLRGSL